MMATKLIEDWARTERDKDAVVQHAQGGDVYAKAATLGFYYDHASQTLAVRGRVLFDAADLEKRPEVKRELERIARDEPARVSAARFDLVRMPWDMGDQPTLYLRKDYAAMTGGESRLFDEWRKLRETAYLWHRTYFAQTVIAVQRRAK